jgi:hypothetical protein
MTSRRASQAPTSALGEVAVFQRVYLWRRDGRQGAPMIWPKPEIRQGGVESLPCTSFRQASPVYPRASKLSMQRHGSQGFSVPEGVNLGEDVHIHWPSGCRAIG